jgi:hypothetical protein
MQLTTQQLRPNKEAGRGKKAARAEIDRRLRENGNAVPIATRAVDGAAHIVMFDEAAPTIRVLAKEMQALQERLVIAGIALSQLTRLEPHRYNPDEPDPLADVRPVLRRLDMLPANWDIAQSIEASPIALIPRGGMRINARYGVGRSRFA